MRDTNQLKKLFFDIVGDYRDITFDKFDFNKWVDWAFDTIEEREKCVMETRYFKRKTLKDTGKMVVNVGAILLPDYYEKKPCDGISGDRVRQIQMKALRKLRHPTMWKKYKATQKGGA